jgi:ribosomal protein S27AE
MRYLYFVLHLLRRVGQYPRKRLPLLVYSILDSWAASRYVLVQCPRCGQNLPMADYHAHLTGRYRADKTGPSCEESHRWARKP